MLHKNVIRYLFDCDARKSKRKRITNFRVVRRVFIVTRLNNTGGVKNNNYLFDTNKSSLSLKRFYFVFYIHKKNNNNTSFVSL